MSTEDSNRRNWLFPVSSDEMDVVLPVNWHETTYIAYEGDGDGINWFVSCIKDKVFLEVNDDPQYFIDHGKEPRVMTWSAVIDHFRAIRYNNVLMYVSGCNNYLTDNIFAARGNYIYPNETTLLHVLLHAGDYSRQTLNCKTLDIDGQECVILGNSAFDLIGNFDFQEPDYIFAKIPLGVLAVDYHYGWMDGCIYDLQLAAATSKSSLINMPDDVRKEVFKSKENK